jgi:glycosyltransferase involved in cell wall biosynthesis
MNPLVSAVIPTHKRPQLVQRAVRSALNQSYPNMEVIVVIDGPEPQIVKALEGFHSPSLRLIELPQNVGQSEARNAGVRAARGEWIAFLDDDDEWLPEKTDRQIAFLAGADQSTNFIVCRSQTADTAITRFWPRDFPHSGENWSEYLACRGCFPAPSTYLVKKQLMMEVPFLKGLSSLEDFDWLLRVTANNQLMAGWLDETLAISHNDGHPATRTTLKRDWDQFYQWILQRRPLLTPRAFSHLLVSHGVPRIKRSQQSPWNLCLAMLRLPYIAIFKGKADLHMYGLLATHLLLTENMRHRLRSLLESARVESARAREIKVPAL